MDWWFSPSAAALTAIAWWYSGRASAASAAGWLENRGYKLPAGFRPEQARIPRRLVFGCNGTVTAGHPAVIDYVHQSRTLSLERVLGAAAALEQDSAHPFAQAIREYVNGKGIIPAEVTGIRAEPGEGVSGFLGKDTVAAGSREFVVVRFGVDRSHLLRVIGTHPNASRVYVAIAGKIAGIFYLEDHLRPEVPAAIARLRRAGVEPVMLTGDNEQAATRAAAFAGIETVFHSLDPQERIARLRELAGSAGETIFADSSGSAGVMGEPLPRPAAPVEGLAVWADQFDALRYFIRWHWTGRVLVLVIAAAVLTLVETGVVGPVAALPLFLATTAGGWITGWKIRIFQPGSSAAPVWRPSEAKNIPPDEARFLVKGISGPDDEAKIVSVLRDVSGFRNARFDIAPGWVHLRFDPLRTSRTRLLEAIRSAGYTDMEQDYLQQVNPGPAGERWK